MTVSTETNARGTLFPPDNTCTGARVARVAPYLLLLETPPAASAVGGFLPLSGGASRKAAPLPTPDAVYTGSPAMRHPSAAQPQPFSNRDQRRARRFGLLRHALPIQAAPRSTFQEA
jgi:hypothetical protein